MKTEQNKIFRCNFCGNFHDRKRDHIPIEEIPQQVVKIWELENPYYIFRRYTNCTIKQPKEYIKSLEKEK